jgi:hypothetical protein
MPPGAVVAQRVLVFRCHWLRSLHHVSCQHPLRKARVPDVQTARKIVILTADLHLYTFCASKVSISNRCRASTPASLAGRMRLPTEFEDDSILKTPSPNDPYFQPQESSTVLLESINNLQYADVGVVCVLALGSSADHSCRYSIALLRRRAPS